MTLNKKFLRELVMDVQCQLIIRELPFDIHYLERKDRNYIEIVVYDYADRIVNGTILNERWSYRYYPETDMMYCDRVDEFGEQIYISDFILDMIELGYSKEYDKMKKAE